jgi:hypothetical protein
VSVGGRYVDYFDGPRQQNMHRRDLFTSTTTLLVENVSEPHMTSVSADGRYVIYHHWRTEYPAGDVMLRRDTVTGVDDLVGIAPAGDPDFALSGEPTMSADGRFIAFMAVDPTPPDQPINQPSPQHKIYVRDMQTATTTTAVVPVVGYPVEQPVISGDGRFLAYHCHDAICLRDLREDNATIISVTEANTPLQGYKAGLAISTDGRFVTYSNTAYWYQPDPPVRGGVYRYDRETNTTTMVVSEETSYTTTVSDDGRYVAFVGGSTLADGALDEESNVYRWDTDTGVVNWVSAPRPPPSEAVQATLGSMTPDGRVAFALATGGVFLQDATTTTPSVTP